MRGSGGEAGVRSVSATLTACRTLTSSASPCWNATGALAVENDDARVLAAATPLQPGSAWTPYVAFTVEGPSIRLLPMSGPAMTCTHERAR